MRSKTPKKRRRGPVIAVIIAAAIAAIAILFLTGVIGGSAQAGFVVDDKATDTTQLTAENAQDALQKAVDESMFSFRINSNMVFANGNEEGEMVIESPAHNRYGMRVELNMKDSGDMVYQTDILPPGTSIVRDKLDTPLPKGEYEAVAMIYAYDMQTQELIGQNAAAITITVEN